MNGTVLRASALAALAAAALSAAGEDRSQDLKKPLAIAAQGSFFVGGETKRSKTLNAAAKAPGTPTEGDITVNQMYVQYQTPAGEPHTPVVMVHGCCLSSKTWETTPDGRMGWNEYFLRKGRPVYLADQVSRARSGFDASILNAVKLGITPPSQLPNIIMASHETSWTLFRFGPTYRVAFPDEQFPIKAVDELYKQMIPDLNAVLPTPNPTWKNLAALAVQLHGAVLMGHSESGFFPEEAALLNPVGIKGIISIEMGCRNLPAPQLANLFKIPILIIFGDHLGDVQGRFASLWPANLASCQTFVSQLSGAGGDVQLMDLPKMGIKGNSHMLMQDKNNLQLADLILGWIDQHVESKGARKP
jgi:hypothetical protein